MRSAERSESLALLERENFRSDHRLQGFRIEERGLFVFPRQEAAN